MLLPFVWHALPTVPLPPPFHLLKCPQSSKAISSKEPLWMSPQAVYVHFFLLWSLICTNYLYVYIMTNPSIFAFGIMVPRFYDLFFFSRKLGWFSFSYVSWHLSYFSIKKKVSKVTFAGFASSFCALGIVYVSCVTWICSLLSPLMDFKYLWTMFVLFFLAWRSWSLIAKIQSK